MTPLMSHFSPNVKVVRFCVAERLILKPGARLPSGEVDGGGHRSLPGEFLPAKNSRFVCEITVKPPYDEVPRLGESSHSVIQKLTQLLGNLAAERGESKGGSPH